MAELRVEDVRISEDFNAWLKRFGVVMPVDHHPTEAGEIVDATGRRVLQVDPDGMLPDDHAQGIAVLVILAVNTCGSFKAGPKQEEAPAS